MLEMVVRAVLTDPYDGALRLLNDASRFGLNFQGLNVEMQSDGLARVNLQVSVTPDVDMESISKRMVRHVNVFDLAIVNAGEIVHSGSNCTA